MNRLTLVRTFAFAAVSAAALLATPLTASAQDFVASPVVAPAAVAPSLGPVAAPVAFARTEAATTEMHLQNEGRDSRNVVWMIVGGGMLIAGSLIGDDVGTIISVTGLVIGLVGVFRYLR